MKKPPSILCLMGPTASGKTKLALELAQRIPCEIVSVDSAMVYRGMDIGTAKPSKKELSQTPHHLIDICDPAEIYSAGQFRKDALIQIEAILARGKIPLLVGGTMLYFHRLQKGLAELPSADKKIREKINAEAEQLGWAVLHEKLKLIDPKAAERIHANDTQRLQRALEIYYATGIPVSELQKIKDSNPLPYTFINLLLVPQDRTFLQGRIEERLEKMLAQGFMEEVSALYQRKDLHADLPSIRSVGYREAWAYLSKEYDFAFMKERIIISTRQLAKRQMTWLRSWEQGEWLDAENIRIEDWALRIERMLLR